MSQPTTPRRGLIFLWLSLAVFLLDLASKYLVVLHFQLYQSLEIFPFFNLTYVRNFGAAFSFLAEHSGWQKALFIGLALVVSAVLVCFLYKNTAKQGLLNSGYALIIGGALGNALNRWLDGYVIDFFDFHIGDWHYPVFNIADIAICIGAVLILWDSFLQEKHKKKDK